MLTEIVAMQGFVDRRRVVRRHWNRLREETIAGSFATDHQLMLILYTRNCNTDM